MTGGSTTHVGMAQNVVVFLSTKYIGNDWITNSGIVCKSHTIKLGKKEFFTSPLICLTQHLQKQNHLSILPISFWMLVILVAFFGSPLTSSPFLQNRVRL